MFIRAVIRGDPSVFYRVLGGVEVKMIYDQVGIRSLSDILK